ncbi:VOC family protein [Hyphomicrobium sp. CS1GBMeth3]|uniref:VOC family protein n=1 Tax=Hyphomicrobium sp. CS1GBMeth3 TaxID=1892845 RepID=UPI000B1053DA
MATIQKITPHLWFNGNAEEAVNFYVSLFDNSRIVSVSRYGKSGPGPEGAVLVIGFELAGQRFAAINAGPEFKFTEAVSFFVGCDSQAEIDTLWAKLTADGGREQPCGWLKDRYGLSWQINSTELPGLMTGDPEAADRVMAAVLQMKKVDIARLKEAHRG